MREEQKEQYLRDGYCAGDVVLNDDEVNLLRQELNRVIGDRDKDCPQPVHLVNLSGDPGSPVWQIVNIWQASAPFRRLMENPGLISAAAALSGGSELRMWHDQVQYKPAVAGGVNMWHQDSPYWPVLEPKDAQLTAWLALDDVDEGNGCMWMIPGSHRWGNQIDFLRSLKTFDDMPDEFEGRKLERRPCPVARGQVHFHHSLTWHGSDANRSSRPRRAVALHFMTEETRYNPQGKHVMQPFIQVQPHERVEGEVFPVVWREEKG